MKKLFKIILILVLILNISFKTKAQEDFSGNRSVSFIVDKSNLNNYINGGREYFEYVFRGYVPEFVEYDFSSDDSNLAISLSFAFTSYDDYVDKLSKLLEYSPNIIYSNDDSLKLLESNKTIELLNFVNNNLNNGTYVVEKSFEDLFTTLVDEIIINDTKYEVNDYVSIRTGEDLIKFRNVSIDTSLSEDGVYSREIFATIDANVAGREERIDELLKSFSDYSKEGMTGNYVQYKINLTGSSLKDLDNQTMLCLDMTILVKEYESNIDDKTIKVEVTEEYDTEGFLENGGKFIYTFNCPSYFENITTTSQELTLSEKSLSANNVSNISFSYERKINFTSIDIETDFSDYLNRITRTITLSLPTKLAIEVNDDIKETLTNRLIKGCSLNIYDLDGTRYYSISYTSILPSEIDTFTKTILNSDDNSFIYNSTWLPLLDNTINDTFNVANIISGFSPSNNINATYKLSNLSFCDKKDEEDTIRLSTSNLNNVELSFKEVNIPKQAVELIGVIVVLIIIVKIRVHMKNKAK